VSNALFHIIFQVPVRSRVPSRQKPRAFYFAFGLSLASNGGWRHNDVRENRPYGIG
jgi:hypothetical protein